MHCVIAWTMFACLSAMPTCYSPQFLPLEEAEEVGEFWTLVPLALLVGFNPSTAIVNGRMQVATYNLSSTDVQPVLLVSLVAADLCRNLLPLGVSFLYW